ncbi:hinge connector of long tail fiber proximal connector [Serratia phage vB_SspM_LC53]|nr:hinge connector of long tail fiber proximal connector [Serratia phage vB_SspM_LC53]
MADLKASSTVGGAVIWHQGNFPLFPVGDSLLYKTFKVYTEKDKPQAIDNDFVSKAQGGEYLKVVNFVEGFGFTDNNGYKIKFGKPGSTEPTVNYSASIKIESPFAFETSENKPFIIFDPSQDLSNPRLTVMGKVIAGEVWDSNTRVFSPANPPTPTDVSLGNVTNDKQVKINTTDLQTMKGELRAPNMSSENPAIEPNQLTRYDQTVLRDADQDFGYYS